MNFRIPDGYQVRDDNLHFVDTPTSVVYQHHIYELISYLSKRSKFTKIVDIGCGSAEKLRTFGKEYSIHCFDTAHVRNLVYQSVPDATFVECDLEQGLPDVDEALFRDAIVVCSDVVEHLRHPDRLLRDLARIANIAPYVLISTPDRNRARGLLEMGPPANVTHTMEWSADEFGRLMLDCGFAPGFPIGFTLNNDHDLAKATILAIAGQEAIFSPPERARTAAAIINIYNEVDIIETTVRHLVTEGVNVHIVDNWSDDGSYEIAQRLAAEGLCRKVHRYPDEVPEDNRWFDMLENTVRIAKELDDDWIIHYDADELRRSPWKNIRLIDAIGFVDQCGYNSIDFTVINFGFIGNEPESGFHPNNYVHFEFGRHSSNLRQIKAWKNDAQEIVLSRSGGHEAEFDGSRTFPLKFATFHYPLRSANQARDKIFASRQMRFAQEKVERGWHTHYDAFSDAMAVEPWQPWELRVYDPHIFDAEYLVERISGIGVIVDDRLLGNAATTAKINAAHVHAYQNVTEECAVLRATVEELRTQGEVTATGIEADRMRTAGFEGDIERLTDALQEARSFNVTLESNLRQRQEEAGQAWAEAARSRTECERLTDVGEALQRQLQKVEEQRVIADGWVFRLAGERRALEKQVGAAASDVRNARRAEERAEAAAQRVRHERLQDAGILARILDEKTALHGDIERLMEQIAAREQDVADLRAQLSNTRIILESVRKNVLTVQARANDAVAGLSRSLHDRERRIEWFRQIYDASPVLASETMRERNIFDGLAYLERHADVAASRLDPLVHYIQYGIVEGRET